jgi:hypothetical protein
VDDNAEIDWSLVIDDYVEPVEEEPEPYKYVIGQDPGGTTGIACLRYLDESLPELVYLHQIPNGQEGYYEFFVGSTPTESTTLVSESFKVRTLAADITPLRIEGIQYAFWQDNTVYQEPKMKKLITDDWLKENNLWTPGKRHQMDGLIHALVWLRNNDHQPTIDALSEEKETEPIAQPGEAAGKELAGAEAGDAEGMEGEEGEGEGDADGAAGGGVVDDTVIPEGSGGNGGEPDSWATEMPEPTGKRKRRERNGVFAGYEPESTEGTLLYED